jgi:Outer membrane protein beta-barrel domain
MTTKRTRVIIALAGLLVASMPALAQGGRYYPERAGAFRVHMGAVQLEGESEYWESKEQDFTGSIDDFEDFSFGASFLLPLHRHLSLDFSGSVFEGDSTNAYRDFEDNFGDSIRHDTTLGIASATLGLMVHFTGPDTVVQPYVGVGGGAYFWYLTEEGDFIDRDLDIFFAELESDGVAFGWYGLAGLEVPISPHFALFGEGRWTQADDELEGDFESFGDLDLSNLEFAVGFSWRL